MLIPIIQYKSLCLHILQINYRSSQLVDILLDTDEIIDVDVLGMNKWRYMNGDG